MKRIVFLTILSVFSQFICCAFAETHFVRVVDHLFIPDDITVEEGDTVRWTWENDFHNVVAGVPFTPTGAFTSALESTGFTYEVLFNRNFLNSNPVVG